MRPRSVFRPGGHGGAARWGRGVDRLALLGLVLLSACASRTGLEPVDVTAGGPAVPYETIFQGIETGDLRNLLEQSSQSVELEDRPPATATLLERRGERDVERLRTVLRSEGYYGASVKVDVDTSVEPARLTFRIDRGPSYRLESVEVALLKTSGPPPAPVPDAAALGLEIGRRARAAEIVDAGDRLLRRLQRQGYPYPKLAERRVVVDHRTQRVRITFRVDPGPRAHFGPTIIAGLNRVEEPYIRRMIPWRQGEPFDISRFTELRTALVDTNLFATVQIQGTETVGPDGELPVTIELTERKRRTVAAGVTYETEEGPGVETSWEHRNLFGRGENLRLGAQASSITLAAEAGFRKPMFRRRDQALLTELRVARDRPDAFESDSVETQALVERELRSDMVAAAGVGFRYARIDEGGEDGDSGTDEFGLVFLPTRFRWDTSDDLLDPSEGGRLALDAAPFRDVLGSGVTFLRSSAYYTHYLRLREAPRIVLAGRGGGGSIIGAARNDIPADERFYVGGGGSVRGYGFQNIGELDEDGDPIGGRSFFEFSAELRVKATESLGFVTFLDGGTVYSATAPDFSETLRLGAGVGFRYFTPVGPLRLDVALPLNPRRTDEDYQLYVSLGQAF